MRWQLTDAEKRENWAAVRKMAKRYFWAAMLPILALLWGAGYAQGLIDAATCRELISKESNDGN